MSTENKKVDFIIVGQGLAGTLVAYFLMQRDQQVVLIDNNHSGASSVVAAGLMNPITGRRLVKSWMTDQLFPFAIKTYRTIEAKFGVELYKEREIIRALFSIGEENQWEERSAFDSYADYMNSEPKIEQLKDIIVDPFSWGGIRKAGQVDVPKLLEIFKNYFIEHKQLIRERFDYDAVEMKSSFVEYKNLTADRIIFCEGHQARFNPWFSGLPFVPSKGEMLEIEIPERQLASVVKHKSYLAPFSKNKYWVGSTYEWDDLSETPSEKGRKLLEQSLSKMLRTDYKITKQLAAIRPTVKDRRPFIGKHKIYQQLYIFNGLGTKGTSLGPYWANEFCDYLLKNKPLEKTVDIARFDN